MKNLTKFFLIFVSVCLFSGCAHVTEVGKKVWGSSIAHLEKARTDGKTLQFALSLDRCFEQTEKILTDAGALIYLKDREKKYLAAMNFKGYVDTTEVGVFFTPLEDGMTEIQVASLSPQLAEDVTNLIFSGLKEVK